MDVLQGSALCVCVLPVELWLVPAVEGVLQLLDEVGLAGHPEEPLLPEAALAHEAHALLNQQGRQTRVCVCVCMCVCVFSSLPQISLFVCLPFISDALLRAL